jgi:transposase
MERLIQSVKSEEITKVIDSLSPAIEAITDNSVKAILNTLITLINEQQKIIIAQQKTIADQQKEIEKLKEKLNNNSNNSSSPPSVDKFKKSKKKSKSKRKQGAQPGHKAVFRELLRIEEVDHVEKCKPPKRCNCGSRIRITDNYRRHQIHELPKVKATVTEYQLYSGICHGCGKIHSAQLPIGVPKGMLGPIAMAKIATLTGDYKMSKRNVTFLLDDFYGLDICVGTVSNTEKIVSEALEKPVEEAKSFIPAQNQVNADETSHFEKGNKMWTWTFIASSVAAFIIRSSRGAQVVKDFLGETFKGILCTDRWSAYTWLAVIFRQLCWAHLKRDFQKISERSGKSGKIGEELLAYTKRMFKYWHKVRDGTLTRERFQKLMAPIQNQVEILLEEGKRCSNKKTAGTCKQILKLKSALWTFIDKSGVEPTNNLAEQVLRRIVIWRKTSFGTQSPEGTLYLERVMTVVATCKLQRRNILDFITDAIRAHLNGIKSPSLLPKIEHQNEDLKAA